MQTNTLVQATATIVQVVSLREGDVYKRLEKKWNDQYALVLGTVTSVNHNGEDAVVTAIEIDSVDGKAASKVFGTGTEVKIFATTPEEVQVAINEALGIADREMEAAQHAYDRAVSSRHLFQVTLERLEAGEVRAPEVKVLEK